MKGRKPLVFVLTALLLIVTFSQVVYADEINEYREYEAKFEAGDIYENPRTQNLGEDPSNITTNKDIWKSEMGTVPKGVYRGHLFPPSKTELGYQPRWRNEYYHDSEETSGTFGYTNIVQKVKIGSDKIMNGATEFWIQVPVDVSTLKVLKLQNDAVTPGNHSKYFSSIQVFEGNYNSTNLTTSFDNTRITQKADFNGDEPEMVTPILPSDYYGDRPYVKVNGYFRSDQTYTFVFNLLTGNSRPQLYITGSENFEPVDMQYGKQMITETKVTYRNFGRRLYGSELIDKDSRDNSYSSFYISGTGDIETEHRDTEVHLATSFIFSEGIGKHKLFGKQLHIESGQHLQFYPDTNWNIDEYNISFYLPFISERKLGGNGVPINISYANAHAWYETTPLTKHVHVNPEISWEFRDFILFSDQETWENKSTETSKVNSRNIWDIRFDEDVTLTIPCHGTETDYQFTNDSFSNHVVDERWNGAKMLLTDDRTDDSNEEDFDGTHEYFYYDPYIVSELLDGKWTQVSNEYGEGKEAYSHAFPVYEYYSNITIEMVDEQNQTIQKNIEDTHGGGEDHDKDLIEKIRGALKNGLNTLWEGQMKIYGYMWDGLKFIWNGITKVFNIIYNSMLDFFDWVKGIAEDVMNVLGILAERLAFMGGMLGFVFVVAGTSKVINITNPKVKKIKDKFRRG